jgi:tetratricopeptide (TPR) repeat protein
LRTTPSLFVAIVGLAALAAARPGRAADDPRGAARVHYARGLELASQNGYEGALREFNEAYALSPEFAVLYNIGQAHIALQHADAAIEALSRYLRDGAGRISPGRRAEVQAQIAYLHAELPNPDLSPEADAARSAAAAAGAAAGGALAAAADVAAGPTARAATLSVRCPEPGLKLTLDGKSLDPAVGARGVPVRPGAHRLALAAPGRRPAEHGLEVPPGASTIVICENPAAAPALDRPRFSLDGPPVFSSAPAAPESGEASGRAATIGYALGGLGLAFGGTAIGVYLWNRGQNQDAETQRAYLTAHPAAPDYYDRAVHHNAEVDAIHQANYLTVGLAIASVGLLAGGFYLWHSDRKRADKAAAETPARAWAAVSPGGLTLAGVW